MRRADAFVLVALAVVLCATAAQADRPLRFVSASTASLGSELVTPRAAPSRTVRLIGESATGAALGIALPFAAYAGFTALQSFIGFFAGFLSASVLGLVLAPIGVIVAGRALGAEGGVGRGVVGALVGLLAGLLVGLPLATIPGAGYLLGLGLFWALPAVGTLIAFEWGRAESPPTGAVVARF